ncbi:hypothetical protein CDAR_457861 [Caerostris darwini]|uniref:Uncharacterized protein n=1 Tax=Caerostris darwini TaxID=1538125 RepID=A0AAV4V884_9ARAC|nr:hypothetical protein CDAR_457861 [Caerostris darwini]
MNSSTVAQHSRNDIPASSRNLLSQTRAISQRHILKQSFYLTTPSFKSRDRQLWCLKFSPCCHSIRRNCIKTAVPVVRSRAMWPPSNVPSLSRSGDSPFPIAINMKSSSIVEIVHLMSQ